MKNILKVIAFLLLILPSLAFGAANYTAEDCENTATHPHVQAAVDSCVGDGVCTSVTVPAGSCTWTSGVSISGKAMTLQGAGTANTIITTNGVWGGSINVTCSTANFVTVKDIYFIGGTNTYPINFYPTSQPQVDCFRFTGNRVASTGTDRRGVTVFDSAYGLIDNNIFEVGSGISAQIITVFGGMLSNVEARAAGYQGWQRALTLGTNNAVYIENNTFNYPANYSGDDSIDAYNGARLVIRYNVFNSTTQGFHGCDSGSRRSAHSYEVYNNSYINNGTTQLRKATLRGGTGVFYNNTYGGTGAAWWEIYLANYRSLGAESDWGICDGTDYRILPTLADHVDYSVVSTTEGSYYCSVSRDTPCTVVGDCPGGETCDSYLDGAAADGYACRDQIGRTTNQVLSPLYIWNNGSIGAATASSHVVAERDYYETAGTVKPGYSAYSCPHPKALLTGSCTSTAGIGGYNQNLPNLTGITTGKLQ